MIGCDSGGVGDDDSTATILDPREEGVVSYHVTWMHVGRIGWRLRITWIEWEVMRDQWFLHKWNQKHLHYVLRPSHITYSTSF